MTFKDAAKWGGRPGQNLSVTERERESISVRERERERGEKKRIAVAQLHFLIELLSGQVNLHSVSVCRLLPRQINTDSLLSAFSSS